MAQSEKELEKLLMEAGNKLLSPPESVQELLNLLDRVEKFLIRVEQSPSESMNEALSPSMKAIIANDLLKHSNVDVRVAVASCISEITRITAPDAPYGDDQMKDVFQLIVSSFEKIDDKSSPSYIKRTSILETVAKVRSCVVMLDLECDALILEMFQHFFRSIRDDHPENVFSSMETIMTLVLEESEDVSLDLVLSILDFLKTDNKEVLPIARQLAEKVVEKCASKLKPYLLPAVKSRGASVNDYSKVVANLCHVGPEAVEPSDGDAASKNLAGESEFGDAPRGDAPREKADEVAMESLDDAPPSEEIGATMAGSPKSVVSNGTIQEEIEDTSQSVDNTKEADHDNFRGIQTDPEPSKASVESIAGEIAKSKSKPVKSNKRKGKRSTAAKRSSKPARSIVNDDKKDTDKLPEQQGGSKEVHSKDSGDAVADESGRTGNNEEQEGSKAVDSKHSEDAVADDLGPARNKEEPEVPLSLEKTSETENEIADVTLPSPIGSPADVSRSKEDGEGKKIDEVVQESAPASDSDSKKESDSKKVSEGTDVSEPRPHKRTGKKKDEVVQESEPASDIGSKKESSSKKASEGTNVSESKPHKRVGKVASSEPDKKERIHNPGDTSTKEDTSNLAVKSAKQPGKKAEVASSQSEDKKKRGQGKGTSPKDRMPLPKSIERSSKEESDVDKACKTSSKKKRSSGKEKVSGSKDHGEELVGSRIRVWWPDDKVYYYGVVQSFDSVKMKHKIVYDDADVEILKLAKEKWNLIEGDNVPDQDGTSEGESPDEASEMPKGKKVKTGDDLRTKRGKVETTAKKGASSRKSKATPKSGAKQKDDSSKVDSKPKEESLKSMAKSNQDKGKSKEESSKSVAKPDQEKSGKSKDSKAGNKSSDEAPKPTGKSKDKNSDPPKATNKSKQDTPKAAPKSSKGKSPKTSIKTNASETEKLKPESSSPKSEEAEDLEKSSEHDEAPETAAKGKSPSASKSHKKGKKRKRGGRS